MSISYGLWSGRVGVVLIALVTSTAAAAQDRLPVGIGYSAGAAFQPQGLPIGSFTLFPTMRISTYHDDNITRGSTGKEVGDTAFITAPSLALRSNWNNHELSASAFLRDTRLFKRGEQNRDEYGASTNGRLDVMRTTSLSGSAEYQNLAERRGTPGDLFLTSRLVRYESSGGTISASHRINRVSLSLGGSLTTFRYDDVATDLGAITQSFRDRSITGLNGRAEYQYSSVASLFVQASANQTRYPRPGEIRNRSSRGASVLGGMRIELTRLLSGEIGLGYLEQNFRDRRFRSFSGIDYSAALSYKPTTLTSFTLSAGRHLSNSALAQVVGVLTSNVTLSVDHELLRYLNLQASGTYSNYVYRGIGRTDNRYDIGAGARYMWSRNLSTVLSVDRVHQDSGDVFGRRYSSNRVTLSLVLAP